MKTRKTISTRTRFEIFKRDSFKCLYCGKAAPEVILHVDHVLPVCEGGTNESANLVTACQACNLGKSGVMLSRIPASLKETARQEREKFAQLNAYNEWLREKRLQHDRWVAQIADFWLRLDGEDPGKWRLGSAREQMVSQFLRRLPAEEIRDALSITYTKSWITKPAERNRYFAGICWKKIKERNST